VAAAAVAAGAADLLPGLEQESLRQRFERRGADPPPKLLVVAIDDRSIGDLGERWPFRRRWHARAIDRLSDGGARAIVYDVQFTEPTTTRDDNALITAIDRARNVVLASAETDERGRTKVLGGADVVREVGATVGASNFPEGRGGVIQRFAHAHGGLPTLATVTAGLFGRAPPASAFPDGGAWIDFHGPAGTIDTVAFSDVVNGRVAPDRVRGRVVVVGATSPTLQDVHPTPAGDRLMAGPEIQANAIDTALRGLPLRAVPQWLALVLAGVLGLLPALLGVRLRPFLAALAGPVIAIGYLLIAQDAFERGRILPVAVPLFALAGGTLAAVTAGYVAERWQHRRVASRNEELELAVAERTAELRATQLEVIQHLGAAVEWRDQETGLHLERMSRTCERVGLALGLSPAEAERLRNASVLHDVGKVGVPDAILQAPGRLSDEARDIMRRHTTIGGDILAGSSSPVMRMAREIALTHHERWDGGGYPDGLAGDQIPLSGRICSVCDVLDALLSERPYKPAWPLEDALAELRRGRGRRFDPAVVDALLEIVDDLDPALLGRAAPDAGQDAVEDDDDTGPRHQPERPPSRAAPPASGR